MQSDTIYEAITQYINEKSSPQIQAHIGSAQGIPVSIEVYHIHNPHIQDPGWIATISIKETTVELEICNTVYGNGIITIGSLEDPNFFTHFDKVIQQHFILK